MTNWKAIQNGDGGWAYSRGCSWTEPTAFALLAQSADSPDRESDTPDRESDTPDRESFQRGVRFLSSIARPDGGWSPQPSVEESTWVTALAVLLPEGAVPEQQRRNAIGWLKSRSGRESGWRYRLQQRLGGIKEDFPDGWPWFPGAAAWVIPTSLGILAFEKALRHKTVEPGEVEDRIASGKKFLLQHACADGGWNHGSNHALGRDGESYPETTGIALLALNGVASPQIERAKATARKHFASCRAAEGIAWLRMGLAAHGETVAPASDPVCRTNLDEALMTLARAQRNPLLET